MPYTIDKVLKDDLVKVVNRDDSRGIYEVRIGDLETVITIKLGRNLDSQETEFNVSHAMKTPTQAGPYRTSIPFADDPPYALHRAITGLTQHYREGIEAGHTPNEGWLVP